MLQDVVKYQYILRLDFDEVTAIRKEGIGSCGQLGLGTAEVKGITP